MGHVSQLLVDVPIHHLTIMILQQILTMDHVVILVVVQMVRLLTITTKHVLMTVLVSQ